MFFGVLLLGVSGASDAQVFRCGNAYSTEPCPGAVTVDVSPALSDPSGPSSTLVYLCRTAGDGLFWLPKPCSTRGWSLVRKERVPIGMPWEDQLRIARSQKRAADALERDRRAVPSSSRSSASVTARPAPGLRDEMECRLLDQRIRALDAQGRQGSTHYSLERIREERKKARDRQFRLGC